MVGLGLGLAIYFTDTPLERFLKNSILNSEHTLQSESEAPYLYIKKIYELRDTIVEDNFEVWRDFNKASQMLYDLLISYRVKDEVMQFHYHEKENKSTMDWIRANITQPMAGIKYKKVQEVKMQVHLRKFLYNTSEFDFAMKLFIDGVKKPNTNDRIILASQNEIKTYDNGEEVLELTYEVPALAIEQIKLGSEFVFISRTIINRELNEYWPSQGGGDRYMAYKFGATDWLSPRGLMIGKRVNNILGTNVRIGSENEVYNPEIWKI